LDRFKRTDGVKSNRGIRFASSELGFLEIPLRPRPSDSNTTVHHYHHQGRRQKIFQGGRVTETEKRPKISKKIPKNTTIILPGGKGGNEIKTENSKK